MNKSITTTKPTHKCMHVAQTKTFLMTAHIRIHFYSAVLILNLNSKSNDELKPHLCTILYYKLSFNKSYIFIQNWWFFPFKIILLWLSENIYYLMHSVAFCVCLDIFSVCNRVCIITGPANYQAPWKETTICLDLCFISSYFFVCTDVSKEDFYKQLSMLEILQDFMAILNILMEREG